MRFPVLVTAAIPLLACSSSPATDVVCPSSAAADANPETIVLAYLTATSSGDMNAAEELMAESSSVFESGGDEGTWQHYAEHHLGPELDAFASFDLRAGAPVTSRSLDHSLALVTLPAEYDIALKDGREVHSTATLTFALALADGKYEITHIHWSSRPRRAKAGHGPKSGSPDLLALETKAYEAARGAFEKHCGSCHTREGKGASRDTLSHFDMTKYPFGGHHASGIGAEVRRSLGHGDGGKATMPADDPGSVTGEDLARIVAWSRAFDEAQKAGLHGTGAKSGHDGDHHHGEEAKGSHDH